MHVGVLHQPATAVAPPQTRLYSLFVGGARGEVVIGCQECGMRDVSVQERRRRSEVT